MRKSMKYTKYEHRLSIRNVCLFPLMWSIYTEGQLRAIVLNCVNAVSPDLKYSTSKSAPVAQWTRQRATGVEETDKDLGSNLAASNI